MRRLVQLRSNIKKSFDLSNYSIDAATLNRGEKYKGLGITFDSRLMFKFGFSESLLKLFRSYLISRMQSIRYRNFYSEIYSPTSRVPQRPNLRPPLFLLFINDIVEHISSEKLLFADDLKLFIETTTDYCRILQTNINTVVEWFKTNPFSLNKKKCFAVSYTKKQDPIIFNCAKRLLI